MYPVGPRWQGFIVLECLPSGEQSGTRPMRLPGGIAGKVSPFLATRGPKKNFFFFKVWVPQRTPPQRRFRKTYITYGYTASCALWKPCIQVSIRPSRIGRKHRCTRLLRKTCGHIPDFTNSPRTSTLPAVRGSGNGSIVHDSLQPIARGSIALTRQPPNLIREGGAFFLRWGVNRGMRRRNNALGPTYRKD